MLQETNGKFESIPTFGLMLRIVIQFILIGWAWLYTRSPEAVAAAAAEGVELDRIEPDADAD